MNGFHEWFDRKRPKGWDNQLGDEPVLNLFYERKCHKILTFLFEKKMDRYYIEQHVILHGLKKGNRFYISYNPARLLLHGFFTMDRFDKLQRQTSIG